jgi:hypothetical protein
MVNNMDAHIVLDQGHAGSAIAAEPVVFELAVPFLALVAGGD